MFLLGLRSGGSKGGADVRPPPPPSDPILHVSEKGKGEEREGGEGKRKKGRRE